MVSLPRNYAHKQQEMAGNAGQTVGGGGPAYPSSGGGGGNGVSLNGNSVTWVGGAASTNRVYGAIS